MRKKQPVYRYKCVLKPGTTYDRGQGVGPSDGYVYLYGNGPWGKLTLDDVERREMCKIDWEPVVLQEGRAAPGK